MFQMLDDYQSGLNGEFLKVASKLLNSAPEMIEAQKQPEYQQIDVPE